jgi:hypothetical protein
MVPWSSLAVLAALSRRRSRVQIPSGPLRIRRAPTSPPGPGQVAQSVERAAENRKVGGSIPSLPTRLDQVSRLGGGIPPLDEPEIVASLRHAGSATSRCPAQCCVASECPRGPGLTITAVPVWWVSHRSPPNGHYAQGTASPTTLCLPVRRRTGREGGRGRLGLGNPLRSGHAVSSRR